MDRFARFKSATKPLPLSVAELNYESKDKPSSRDSGYPDWEMESRHRSGSISSGGDRRNGRTEVSGGLATLGRRRSEFHPPPSPQFGHRATPPFGRGMMQSSSVTDLNMIPPHPTPFSPMFQVRRASCTTVIQANSPHPFLGAVARSSELPELQPRDGVG